MPWKSVLSHFKPKRKAHVVEKTVKILFVIQPIGRAGHYVSTTRENNTKKRCSKCPLWLRGSSGACVKCVYVEIVLKKVFQFSCKWKFVVAY